MKLNILRIALDVCLNNITEHTRDLAYKVSDEYANDHDWILYIRGCANPVATRELIIEEWINDNLRTILPRYKRY